MKKIPLIVSLTTLALVVSGVFLLSKPPKATPNSSFTPPSDTYTYFWGNGCPHCANVEKFLESWNKKNSIKINQKEVWQNKTNANLMKDANDKICKFPLNNLAVPLLITPEGKCIMGDEPIIDFFKSL